MSRDRAQAPALAASQAPATWLLAHDRARRSCGSPVPHPTAGDAPALPRRLYVIRRFRTSVILASYQLHSGPSPEDRARLTAIFRVPEIGCLPFSVFATPVDPMIGAKELCIKIHHRRAGDTSAHAAFRVRRTAGAPQLGGWVGVLGWCCGCGHGDGMPVGAVLIRMDGVLIVPMQGMRLGGR